MRTTPVAGGARAVHARQVAFRYPGGRGSPGAPALSGVDLEVVSGERVAVLGPNGSGKSTLLRLLATDLRPTGGSLDLFGLPAVPPSPQVRRRVAWVPERGSHLAELTGVENARFFLRLRGVEAGPRLDGLLSAFRLGEARDVPVGRYSFGMGRKLLLAEAFSADADLLCLDEPTVGLDPPAIEALARALDGAAGRGAAVVFATNDVQRAEAWASRVVFLHRGRIVEDADPAALLAKLRGSTRIEVAAEGPIPAPPTLEGVRAVRTDGNRLEAESSVGGRCLPPLLGALVESGVRVREVRLREPDLADLFLERTGERLGGAAPATGGGAAPATDGGAAPTTDGEPA